LRAIIKTRRSRSYLTYAHKEILFSDIHEYFTT